MESIDMQVWFQKNSNRIELNFRPSCAIIRTDPQATDCDPRGGWLDTHRHRVSDPWSRLSWAHSLLVQKKKMKPGRFKYKHAELTLPLLLCALPPCQSVPQERGKLIFAPLTRTNFDKSVHKNAALLPKVGMLHPPTEVSHKIIVWLKNQTHAGL